MRVEGGVRLVRAGRPLASPATLGRRELSAGTFLQGVHASAAAGDAALVVEAGTSTIRVPLTVVGISFLSGDNERIDARTDALGVSHAITNDSTLPRASDWSAGSRDGDDVRLEIFDPRIADDTITATLVDEPRAQSRSSSSRTLTLARPRADAPFRSDWVRLVGDVMDQEAPGVGDRVLRVSLRSTVRARYATPSGEVEQSLRVGRPGDEDGPRAARSAHLAIRIVRHRPGGVPAVGGDEAGALRIARDQVRIANEILAPMLRRVRTEPRRRRPRGRPSAARAARDRRRVRAAGAWGRCRPVTRPGTRHPPRADAARRAAGADRARRRRGPRRARAPRDRHREPARGVRRGGERRRRRPRRAGGPRPTRARRGRAAVVRLETRCAGRERGSQRRAPRVRQHDGRSRDARGANDVEGPHGLGPVDDSSSSS